MMKIFKNIENKYRKPVAGTHGEAQHRRAHGSPMVRCAPNQANGGLPQ